MEDQSHLSKGGLWEIAIEHLPKHYWENLWGNFLLKNIWVINFVVLDLKTKVVEKTFIEEVLEIKNIRGQFNSKSLQNPRLQSKEFKRQKIKTTRSWIIR